MRRRPYNELTMWGVMLSVVIAVPEPPTTTMLIAGMLLILAPIAVRKMYRQWSAKAKESISTEPR